MQSLSPDMFSQLLVELICQVLPVLAGMISLSSIWTVLSLLGYAEVLILVISVSARGRGGMDLKKGKYFLAGHVAQVRLMHALQMGFV